MRLLLPIALLLPGCMNGVCEQTKCTNSVSAVCGETADCSSDGGITSQPKPQLVAGQSLRMRISVPFTTYRTIRVILKPATSEAVGAQRVAVSVDGVEGTASPSGSTFVFPPLTRTNPEVEIRLLGPGTAPCTVSLEVIDEAQPCTVCKD